MSFAAGERISRWAAWFTDSGQGARPWIMLWLQSGKEEGGQHCLFFFCPAVVILKGGNQAAIHEKLARVYFAYGRGMASVIIDRWLRPRGKGEIVQFSIGWKTGGTHSNYC